MSRIKDEVSKILEKELEILENNNDFEELLKANNTPLSISYTMGSLNEAIKELFGYEIFDVNNLVLNKFDYIDGEKLNTVEANYNLIKDSLNSDFNSSLRILKSMLSVDDMFNDSNFKNIVSQDDIDNDIVNSKSEYENVKQLIAPHTIKEISSRKIYINNIKNNLIYIKSIDSTLYEKLNILIENEAIIDIINSSADVYREYDEAELNDEYLDILTYINEKIATIESNITQSKAKKQNKINISDNNVVVIKSAVEYFNRLIASIYDYLHGSIKSEFVNKYGDISYTITNDDIYFNSDSDTYIKYDYNVLFELDNVFITGDTSGDNYLSDFASLISNLENNSDNLNEYVKIVESIKNHDIFNRDINIFKDDIKSTIETGSSLIGKVSCDDNAKIKMYYMSEITNKSTEYIYDDVNEISYTYLQKVYQPKNLTNCYFDVTSSEDYIDNSDISRISREGNLAIWSRDLYKVSKNGFIRFKSSSIETSSRLQLNVEDIKAEYVSKNNSIYIDINYLYDIISNGVDVISIKEDDLSANPNEIMSAVLNLTQNVKTGINFYLSSISDMIHISYFKSRVSMLSSKASIFKKVEDAISSKGKLKVTLKEIFKMKKQLEDLIDSIDLSLGDENGLRNFNVDSKINSISIFFEKVSQLILLMTIQSDDFKLDHVKITENVLGRYTDFVDIILMLFDNLINVSRSKTSSIQSQSNLLIDFKRKLLGVTYTIIPSEYLNSNLVIDVDNASENEIDDIVLELNIALDTIIEKLDRDGERVKDTMSAMLAPIKSVTKVVTTVITFIVMYKKYPTLMDDMLLLIFELMIRNLSENILYQPIAEHYTEWIKFKTRLSVNYSNAIKEVKLGDVLNENMDVLQNDISNVDAYIKDQINSIDVDFSTLGYIDDSITKSIADKMLDDKDEYDMYINSIKDKGDYTSMFDVDLSELYMKRIYKDKAIFYHPFRTTDEKEQDEIVSVFSYIILFEFVINQTINDMLINNTVYDNYIISKLTSFRSEINAKINVLESIGIKNYLISYMNKYDETNGIISSSSYAVDDGYYTFAYVDVSSILKDSITNSSKYKNGLQLLTDLVYTKDKKFKQNDITISFDIKENMYDEIKDEYFNIYSDDYTEFMNSVYYLGLSIIDTDDEMEELNKTLNLLYKYTQSSKTSSEIGDIDEIEFDTYSVSMYSDSIINAHLIDYYFTKNVSKNNNQYNNDTDECDSKAINSLMINSDVPSSFSLIGMDVGDLFDLSVVDRLFDKISDLINMIVDSISKIRQLSFLTAKKNLEFWNSDLSALSNRLSDLLNQCESKDFVEDIVLNNSSENLFCQSIRCFWDEDMISKFVDNYIESNFDYCTDMIEDLFIKLTDIRKTRLEKMESESDLLTSDESKSLLSIVKKLEDVYSEYNIKLEEGLFTVNADILLPKFVKCYIDYSGNYEFELFRLACNDVIDEFKVSRISIDMIDVDVTAVSAVRIIAYSDDDEFRLMTFDEFKDAIILMFEKSYNNNITSLKNKLNSNVLGRTDANILLQESLNDINITLRLRNLYNMLIRFENDDFESTDLYRMVERYKSSVTDYQSGIYEGIYVDSIIMPKNTEEAEAIKNLEDSASHFIIDFQFKGSFSYDLFKLKTIYSDDEVDDRKNEKQILYGELIYTKGLDDLDYWFINSNLFIKNSHTNDIGNIGILNFEQDDIDFCDTDEPVNVILGLIEIDKKIKKNNKDKDSTQKYSTDNTAPLGDALNMVTDIVSSASEDIGNKLKSLLDDLNNQDIISKFYDMLNSCILDVDTVSKNNLNIKFPNYKTNAINMFKKYNSEDLMTSSNVEEDDDKGNNYCI